jgi:hypothetical protein
MTDHKRLLRCWQTRQREKQKQTAVVEEHPSDGEDENESALDVSAEVVILAHAFATFVGPLLHEIEGQGDKFVDASKESDVDHAGSAGGEEKAAAVSSI